jgi:hypothetical protein
MAKSYEIVLQGLYAAICEDISSQVPCLREDLRRDLLRLGSCMETRGLSFFTIDLVNAGKHFDQCISRGLLTSSGLPLSRPFKTGVTIPRLFKGLYLRVFHTNGELKGDADVVSIRALRQLFYAAKKLRMECTNERTFKEVTQFFSVDRAVRLGSLSWDSDDFRADLASNLHFGDSSRCHSDSSDPLLPFWDEEEEAPLCVGRLADLQQVCDIVSSQIGRFDPYQWRVKHGPGAVSDHKGSETKYLFPTWPRKLDNVFPLADFAFANFGLWSDAILWDSSIQRRFSLHEPPSRLISVPKTQKAPRLIASEPTAHLWSQQGVKDFLSHRVQRTSIRRSLIFDDQSPNQRLATQASRTGSHWTIDLSSASDMVSCYAVERLFRRNESLLRALHAVRTRWIVNTIDRKSPKFHRLRKFTTMGSACTFPVESILFVCIAVASVLSARGQRPTVKSISSVSEEVQVYGDDIIVPADSGSLALELLGHLGFQVNRSKTFGTGKFRESCGVDMYDGTNVTPTYTMTYPSKARPESVISWVETHNNFFRNGWWSVSAWMKSSLLRRYPYRIPEVPADSGSFGWSSYDVTVPSTILRRWNSETHVMEWRVHSLYQRANLRPIGGGESLLQYFTEAPAPHLMWKAGHRSRPQLLAKLRWEAIPRDITLV